MVSWVTWLAQHRQLECLAQQLTTFFWCWEQVTAPESSPPFLWVEFGLIYWFRCKLSSNLTKEEMIGSQWYVIFGISWLIIQWSRGQENVCFVSQMRQWVMSHQVGSGVFFILLLNATGKTNGWWIPSHFCFPMMGNLGQWKTTKVDKTTKTGYDKAVSWGTIGKGDKEWFTVKASLSNLHHHDKLVTDFLLQTGPNHQYTECHRTTVHRYESLSAGKLHDWFNSIFCKRCV